MEKGRPAGRAGQVLLAAYPDERQREHAARWLGWIAYRTGGGASFRVRSFKGWVDRRWLGLMGFLRALPVICVLAGGIYLVALYLGDTVALALALFPGSIIAVWLALLLDRLPGSRRAHGGWLSTRPAGQALPLRWVRLGRLLADAADRGVLRRAGPGYTFADPATAANLAAPYHARAAERARRAAGRAREPATLAAQPGRAALIAFLTDGRRNRISVDFGVGATVLAFSFYPFAYNPPHTWLTTVGQFTLLAAGLGAAGALVAWPALPLLHRLSGWSLRTVRGLSSRGRKLATAAALLVAAASAGALVFSALPRTVIRTPGPRWQIAGLAVLYAVWLGAVQALFYAGGVAALRQVFHGRLRTIVLAAAVAGAVAIVVFPYLVRDRPDGWFFIVSVFAITVGELGTACAVLAGCALEMFRRLAGWSLRNVLGLSRRWLLVALVAAAGVAIALGAAGGTVLTRAVEFTLPAACVAACGLWVGMLAVRMTRGKTRWLRLPDAIGAATTAATLLVLTNHNLLTVWRATGLLVPVVIWGGIRTWLAMKSADRVFPRGGI